MHIWSHVNQDAWESPGSTSLVAHDDGFRWTLQRSVDRLITLDMRKWAATCEFAIRNFQQAITTLLTADNRAVLTTFPFEKIQDHDARGAPHRQPTNEMWLTPLRDTVSNDIVQSLSVASELSSLQVQKWLNKEQEALRYLALIFCLGCGISFRGWQLSSIFFDCSDEVDRNVWILKDGTIIVANPKAKQRNMDRFPTLLAFPKCMSKHIAFYLYVIRGVACDLLKLSNVDASLHSICLWVQSNKIKKSKIQPATPWTGLHISKIVQAFTQKVMGVSLSPLTIRQAAQAVFRDKFPCLFSLGPIQSDWAFDNFQEHCHQYGFPTLQMSPESCGRLLTVSQIWQALLNLESVNPAWLSTVDTSHMFFIFNKNHYEQVVCAARELVRQAPTSVSQSIINNRQYVSKSLTPGLTKFLRNAGDPLR